MIRIDKFKQYLTITSLTFSKLLFTLYDFNKSLTTYKMDIKRKNYREKPVLTKEIDKKFFILETENPSIPDSKNQIRYNISLLDTLLEYLGERGIDTSTIKIVEHECYVFDPIEIKHNPDYTPRPYQQKCADTTVKWDKNSILYNIGTGLGKTFISMYTMSLMKKRFSVIVLPRYIEKWIGDVTHLTDIKREEILVIQGSKALIDMLLTPVDELKHYKASIISLKSYTLFIKNYLEHTLPSIEGLTPDNVFKHLSTEIVVSDESHQEYFRVNEVSLFGNLRLVIGLTATLLSKDEDMERMYQLLFPDKHRITNIIPVDKYILVYAIRYTFQNKNRIRYKTQFGYNHATFESSLFKQSVIRNNYFKMVSLFLEKSYLIRRDKGDKALVFFGTVDMCSKFIEFLSSDNKYGGLNINKYTQEDDYSIIGESDIIASTIGSSGTALDIPNLITVLQTVSVGSYQANIQTLGRLRKQEKDTLFIYFYSSDIPSQIKHSSTRYKLFRNKVKQITSVSYRDYV